MGREVIESAKAVVVKKSQTALQSQDATVCEKLFELEKQQESLQTQISDVSTKLDLILSALKNH